MTADVDILRRAAALVRREGGEATPGPWSRAMKTRTKSAIVAPTPDDAEFYLRDREHVAICSVPHFDGGGGFARARSGRDLDWIALADPALAVPLADLLDAAAVDEENHNRAGDFRSAFTDYALGVARAVLGACASCAGTGTVCADDGPTETHPGELHPWSGTSPRSDACDHGGGTPCPRCSPDPTSSDRSRR